MSNTPPFRVRVPTGFGQFEFWPDDYPTEYAASEDVRRVGNSRAEVIDADNTLVAHSAHWWKTKSGKDGRP